jgi:glyceraldehyde 3-phosphate dehydrogenase
MSSRVAINGFGRIGRSALRAALTRQTACEIVAINDITDAATLAHLFAHDSIYGAFPGEVSAEGAQLKVGERRIAVLAERDPARLPWRELEIDTVLESTGLFTARDRAAAHLLAGARRVVISAPGKLADFTVVLGVNDRDYDPERHEVISNASCTTNCLAPVAKVLHEAVGIRHGLVTTVHAYTSDQRLQDAPHSDLRRARAAAVNLVPTSTGAARAVGLVLPDLAGRLHGMAVRAPVTCGSLVDLTFEAQRETTVEEVNGALARAAASADLQRIIQYTHAPLVSSDIVGNSHSSIVDAELTAVIDERLVKVIAWYDNEWGYANRCVDLLEQLVGVAGAAAA